MYSTQVLISGVSSPSGSDPQERAASFRTDGAGQEARAPAASEGCMRAVRGSEAPPSRLRNGRISDGGTERVHLDLGFPRVFILVRAEGSASLEF